MGSIISEPFALGTAGGFLNTSACADDQTNSFLVLNGDSLVFEDLNQFVSTSEKLGVCGILGVYVEDTSRYGRLRCGRNGYLKEFQEKIPGSGIISAGIYYIKREVLCKFPEGVPLSFEYDFFPKLLSDKEKVYVFKSKASFLDIGTPESLKFASEFIGTSASFCSYILGNITV